jgi:hypothetical protein
MLQLIFNEKAAMKKLIKLVCIASLSLLTACGEQGVKLQVEPMMPVPVLIVPDHGDNNQNNNYLNNPPPQEYTPPVQPQPQRKNSRHKHQRNDNNGYNNPPQYEGNRSDDYRYDY